MSPRDHDDPFAARIHRSLIEHGLSEDAARVTRQAGEAVAIRTRASGREWAALIDAESGALVNGFVEGSRRSVNISPLLSATVRGRIYAQVHSHEASTAFSIHDVLLLTERRKISVVAAIA